MPQFSFQIKKTSLSKYRSHKKKPTLIFLKYDLHCHIIEKLYVETIKEWKYFRHNVKLSRRKFFYKFEVVIRLVEHDDPWFCKALFGSPFLASEIRHLYQILPVCLCGLGLLHINNHCLKYVSQCYWVCHIWLTSCLSLAKLGKLLI